MWRALQVDSERSFYRGQGIEFRGSIAPIGVEDRVTLLLREGLTRDNLFQRRNSEDFIGTTRGLRVQLYAVSRPAVEAITAPGLAGVSIDRDSPAAHSIGRLTPRALTFESAAVTGFRVRKQNIRRAVDAEIALKFATRTRVPALPIQTASVDLRPLVIRWARAVMGDLVWGPGMGSQPIHYIDSAGQRVPVEFRTALHETFGGVRRYSTRPLLRMFPEMSRIAITPEAFRLARNISSVRAFTVAGLSRVPEGHAARVLSDLNAADGIDTAATLDDVLTCYLAGVDTLAATVIASLWHTLHPLNREWKDTFLSSGEDDQLAVAEAHVQEALRLSPPGSAFNNRIIQDVEITVGQRTYRLRKGTLIMPQMHAVHAQSGSDFNPGRFLAAGADPFFMAFGRGARSCPGRPAGLSVASIFLTNFMRTNPTATVANPSVNAAKFNTTSDHPLNIVTA